MTALLQDLRYAVRLLLRTPGFSLLAVLTLALGIGANAAIFSVIDAVLLAPLPYSSPERLTIVYSQFPSMSFDRFWVSAPEFLDLRQSSKSFEALGAYTVGAANITGQRATAGAGRQLLRKVLVIVEVGLAATLVIVGGLLIRSFWLLQQVDPGFDAENVLTFQIALPDARYPGEPQVVAFYQRLVDRLRVLPGVESAAAAWGLPPKPDILANDTEFEGCPGRRPGPSTTWTTGSS